MAILNSVQKVTGKITPGAATTTVVIPIAIRPSSSFLVVGMDSNGKYAQEVLFDYRFLGSTTFSIQRGDASSRTYNFVGYVSMFDSGVSVQHQSRVVTPGVRYSASFTLTESVFLSTSFILCTHSGASSGTLRNGQRAFTANLKDTNADGKADIVLIRNPGTATAKATRFSFQVLTHDGVSVQRGETRSLQTDPTEITASIATATPAQSIILTTVWAEGLQPMKEKRGCMWASRFPSQTQVAHARGFVHPTEEHSSTISHQVVRFFDGTKVQHVPFSLDTAEKSGTAVITSVVQANSLVLTQMGMGDGLYCAGLLRGSTSENIGQCRGTFNLLNPTQIRVERSTATATSLFNLTVITFSTGVSTIDLEPINGELDLSPREQSVQAESVGITPNSGALHVTGLSVQSSETDLVPDAGAWGTESSDGLNSPGIDVQIDLSPVEISPFPLAGDISFSGNVVSIVTRRGWQPVPIDRRGWRNVA